MMTSLSIGVAVLLLTLIFLAGSPRVPAREKLRLTKRDTGTAHERIRRRKRP